MQVGAVYHRISPNTRQPISTTFRNPHSYFDQVQSMLAARHALICFTLVAVGSANANADIILTITENTTLGGTDWSFSGGTGVASGSGTHFLPGATLANPQPFHAVFGSDTSLTVLAGTNAFNITNLFVHNYGGLPGTNGDIYDGLDFQNFTVPIGGASLSSLNGLVLNANSIPFSSFNPGTYVLDSYYAPYNTDLGTFTVIIGQAEPEPVPEPASIAVWSLLLLAGMTVVYIRRRKLQPVLN